MDIISSLKKEKQEFNQLRDTLQKLVDENVSLKSKQIDVKERIDALLPELTDMQEIKRTQDNFDSILRNNKLVICFFSIIALAIFGGVNAFMLLVLKSSGIASVIVSFAITYLISNDIFSELFSNIKKLYEKKSMDVAGVLEKLESKKKELDAKLEVIEKELGKNLQDKSLLERKLSNKYVDINLLLELLLASNTREVTIDYNIGEKIAQNCEEETLRRMKYGSKRNN